MYHEPLSQCISFLPVTVTNIRVYFTSTSQCIIEGSQDRHSGNPEAGTAEESYSQALVLLFDRSCFFLI